MSLRLFIKNLVTTEPIGFYSSGNIPNAHLVVLGYFLGGWENPPPKKKKKKLFKAVNLKVVVEAPLTSLGNVPRG